MTKRTNCLGMVI